MAAPLRIALAQCNPHEGQIEHNLRHIRTLRAEVAALGADLLVTPEFSIAGYPPEDLVRKAAFVEQCETALAALA
ncbi:MAG TPA: nitrilase-related carbon-nitrogen hydrolase, partial [Acetobacteraceae bacterium]|nr:nitrilase-related carbon-nitrogen hydrolase [Acetobacteraceae bacterium]